MRYLGTRLKEKGCQVKHKPHYKTSQGRRIPDLVLHTDHQSVLLDVQVVRTSVSLSETYHMKRKYMIPAPLNHTNPNSLPIVAAVTMSYRGTWAKETVQTLIDLGLARHDIKTIRCLQGGLRAFRVHQKMTAVQPRVKDNRAYMV